MNKEEQMIVIVGENIAYYRKKMNLTQSELAEKLGYSDKSISKWERKEGIPSVIVLNELASFFGITLNDITKEVKIHKPFKHNKRVISFFYASIPFFASLILFAIGLAFDLNYEIWKVILYGVCGSAITLFVFSIVHKQRLEMYAYLSIFIWVLATTVYLEFAINNRYIIFLIAAALNIFSLYLMKIIYLNKSK